MGPGHRHQPVRHAVPQPGDHGCHAEQGHGAVPLHRLAQPADLANAVAFFASEEAAYITGQTLSVRGGLTMA
ncbi:SDR family oxidoreductase [Specibacter cremeus]|uniref:SDR family oxidoreductase n=1 Tax=Specibacter cremeus TaxID=1629051 RepID=UPI00197C11F7|nr:SDR family oxidoreductase [Specibacter cremeus]